MSEALGMALPGSALIPASLTEIGRLARTAGRQVMELAKREIRAADILTPDAFENAMKVHAAISGSTNALIHLPTGEPANAMRLRGDLEAAEKMYRTKGYMAAKIQSEATLDDTSHTVRYTIRVSEGDQYKMGELEIQGLDTNAASRVAGVWSLREGEPYDASYANRFLNEAIKVLPKDVTWSVDIHESPNEDEDEKTVDVNLRFFTK
jgi:outer membrane protein assembly factor BamA